MSAWTSHVTHTIIVFSSKPSFHSCLEHFPLSPATKDSYYASTEVSPCAHVPLLLHNTHSMETRLAYLLDQSARSTSHTSAPTTPFHRNTSLVCVPDDIDQPTCIFNASRASPHAPRSLGQPMMARQTGHVTSRAGCNDGPTTMPSFCSTISTGTLIPMLR